MAKSKAVRKAVLLHNPIDATKPEPRTFGAALAYYSQITINGKVYNLEVVQNAPNR